MCIRDSSHIFTIAFLRLLLPLSFLFLRLTLGLARLPFFLLLLFLLLALDPLVVFAFFLFGVELLVLGIVDLLLSIGSLLAGRHGVVPLKIFAALDSLVSVGQLLDPFLKFRLVEVQINAPDGDLVHGDQAFEFFSELNFFVRDELLLLCGELIAI